MIKVNLSKLILLCGFLFFFIGAIGQQCIELPPISGAPSVGSAPVGWSVWQNTPDIISGNGPWPGGTYVTSNVNGFSAAGGSMGLFLANGGTNPSTWEGWATTLTGLTPGNSYSVSCEWQQATLSSGGINYSGGDLMMIVNGVPNVFTSVGGLNDPWQVATVTFTAAAGTAAFQFKVSEYATGVPPGFYGSAIVVDNMICNAINLGVTLNSGTICAGSCFDLLATPSNATGGVSYVWDNGITNTTAGPITVCPTSTTTYQVTATDASGSTSTTSTTITVTPSPNIDLGNDTLICNGSSLILNAGNPGSTYLWNNNSTAQTLTALTSGTYWVTATNGNCTDTDSVVVTFQPIDVNLGSDITLCSGETFMLDAGNPGANYLWNDNSTSQQLNGSTPGTYWVTTTLGSCTDSDTIVVSYQTVNVNLGNDTTICLGSSVTLDAGNVGATFVWSDASTNQTLIINSNGTYWVQTTIGSCVNSDTLILSVIDVNVNLGNDTILCEAPSLTLDAGNAGASYLWSDNSTNQQLNVSALGTYWVTVTSGMCTDSDTIVIDFQPFSVNLGNDTLICSGSTLVLNAGNPGSAYTWNNATTAQTLSVNTSGTYWVEAVLGNCAYTDTINVVVVDVNVNLGNDLLLCDASSLTLDAGNPGASYLWSDNSTNQLLNVNNPGNYWVTVSSGICSDSDTVVITEQVLTPFFFANITEGCVPLAVDFIDESLVTNGTITNWLWSFGNGQVSSLQHPSNVYQGSGNFDVSLTITTDIGCTETLMINDYITSFPNALAGFNAPFTALSGDDVHFINTSVNSNSWVWDINGEDTYTSQDVMYVFDEAGAYSVTLIAMNEFGCNDTVSHTVTIVIEPIVYVPNTFTPDGDQANQTWKYFISEIDTYDFSMRVYNRWGELIWESHDPSVGWDGVYLGNLVESGTYVWVMEFGDYSNDSRHSHTGHVNVLR